ncbi:MAG: hypothetical protein D6730_24830 [Bacteroidetes bacterium]|nr:MAG: hypothetical protein D6730_24830 [Bacteroidota bacterium]
MRKFPGMFRTHPATLLTLADQALVSGSNFVLGIWLTRQLGLEGYGLFALAWMGVILSSSLQQALVIAPMMSLGPGMQPQQRQAYYHRCFFLQLTFCLLAGSVALAMLCLGDLWQLDMRLQSLRLVLPFTIMAFLMQEYMRRLYLIRAAALRALLLDALAYTGSLLGIFLLGWRGSLGVSTALLAVGVCFGLAALLGLRALAPPWPGWKALWGVIRRHWVFARWLGGTAVLQFFSSNYFLIAAAAVLGPAAVGALRIAQNLVGVTHVLFLAMENLIPVKAATAYHRDGLQGLQAYMWAVSLKAFLLVAVLLGGMGLLAPWLIRLLYGPAYEGYSYLLVAYCLLYLLVFPGYLLRYMLRTLEYTQPILGAYVLSAIFSLLAATFFVEQWELLGVIYGLCTAQGMMLMCYGLFLWQKMRRLGASPSLPFER